MKILYVKSNSERAKKYQLQTMIFEENGTKFVKKKALCDEAIPHLMQMKKHYDLLISSITDPAIHPAKIIKSTDNSLTFEFIGGSSAEHRLLDTLKSKKEENIKKELDRYKMLITEGFKTTVCTPQGLTTPEGRQIFEGVDLSQLGETLCFDGYANIDLIFSNILYQEDSIHLIDYEWVFEGSIPVNFALFRAFRSLHYPEKLGIDHYFTQTELSIYQAMEKRLVYFEIMPANSFYQTQARYEKNRINMYELISDIKEEITGLNQIIKQKEESIDNLNEELNELTNEVVFYSSSRSWKITRPLRKLFTYSRGMK